MRRSRRSSAGKRIRVGVVGLGRGVRFALQATESVGMEAAAVCDVHRGRLAQAKRSLSAEGKRVATYADFEKFLEHDLDAVILSNYFHEHAPFAIQALKAGKHVMSETTACLTPAEGVALVDAVEKSGKTYMLAENYPYMPFNQEMRRIFRTGKIGTFVYGEGEYVHPADAPYWNHMSCGVNHWRNWIPATYYCTHSLAPIMFITDTWPMKVNGFVMPYAKDDPTWVRSARRNDAASMIVLRMDSGAVVKLLQVHLRGEGIWVRIHGSRGQMENLRHGDSKMVRLRREQYHEKRTEPEEQIYRPDFPVHHAEATRAGHMGGDFFMNYYFVEAIRTGRPPFFDVYRGVAMSLVGILAYRSALQGSDSVDVPDFRKKAERDKYREDHWNPDPTRRREGDPWPSIRGDVKLTKRQLAYARKDWQTMGYSGE